MSNEVYPTLAGLNFPVQRSLLPPKVEVRTTPSEREYRARSATLNRYQYALGYDWLYHGNRGADLATLLGFYSRHGGPFDSWLFDDPDDNTVSGQAIGTGNGSTTAYQLVRTFGNFAEPITATQPGAVVSVAGLPAVNLLWQYGAFEVDSNSDGLANGWITHSAGTGTGRQPDGLQPGNGSTYSQRMYAATLGATASDQYGLRHATDFAVEGGSTYTVACDVYGTTTACQARIYVDWFTSAMSPISPTTQSWAMTLGWTRRSITAVAPANAAFARLYLWMEANTSGGALASYYDNVQFQMGSVATAFSTNLAALSNGIATFAVAPASGTALTWSGKFYRRCRFLGDRMDTNKFMQDMFEAKRVEFISTKA